MKTRIIVNLQIEGIHSWPNCPIPEVSYLKFPHRHIFHVKCTKNVSHDDRDIEIIQLKHKLTEYLVSKYFKQEFNCLFFSNRSCEMLSEELLTTFDLDYCSFLEDGENGAEVFKD